MKHIKIYILSGCCLALLGTSMPNAVGDRAAYRQWPDNNTRRARYNGQGSDNNNTLRVRQRETINPTNEDMSNERLNESYELGHRRYYSNNYRPSIQEEESNQEESDQEEESEGRGPIPYGGIAELFEEETPTDPTSGEPQDETGVSSSSDMSATNEMAQDQERTKKKKDIVKDKKKKSKKAKKEKTPEEIAAKKSKKEQKKAAKAAKKAAKKAKKNQDLLNETDTQQEEVQA